MRQHTVPENLLLQAIAALRERAAERYPGSPAVAYEWRTADELEAIMKHPVAKPHVARTHRPAHNI